MKTRTKQVYFRGFARSWEGFIFHALFLRLFTFDAHFRPAGLAKTYSSVDGEPQGAMEEELKFLRRDCKLSILSCSLKRHTSPPPNPQGGGGGGERRLNSERYNAVRERELLLRIWVFFDWLLPFRNRKPFIIPKAVELNRITKHNKCKCEEFFFLTRRGSGICSYDVIMHEPFRRLSPPRAPLVRGWRRMTFQTTFLAPPPDRAPREIPNLSDPTRKKLRFFFLTNLVTMKTPNDERQT